MDTLAIAKGRRTNGNLAPSSVRDAALFVLRLRSTAKSRLASAFSDSAWNLLLALYTKEGAGRTSSIGDLAARADIPRSTTLRWLINLESKKIVRLARDIDDRRIVRVQLTPAGLEAIQYCLAAASEATADEVGIGQQ